MAAGPVRVSESGNATGPYKGTFADGAGFIAYCGQSLNTPVNGTFAIAAGADTINGTFSGSGTGSCGAHAWGQTCYFYSSQVTYSASLTRGGKVRKQFYGNASVKIGVINSSNHMDLTLKDM